MGLLGTENAGRLVTEASLVWQLCPCHWNSFSPGTLGNQELQRVSEIVVGVLRFWKVMDAPVVWGKNMLCLCS